MTKTETDALDATSSTTVEPRLDTELLDVDNELSLGDTQNENTLNLPDSVVKEEENYSKISQREHEQRMRAEERLRFNEDVKEQRMKRLNFLLKRSNTYATILSQRMEKQREEKEKARIRMESEELETATAALTTEDTDDNKKKNNEKPTRTLRTRSSPRGHSTISTTTTTTTTSKRRKTTADAEYQLEDYLDEESVKRHKNNDSIATTIQKNTTTGNDKKKKGDDDGLIKLTYAARQPSLVTGGTMRDYQLAGMEWLITLWENGLNGILADEMGLGKTLQTISFIAHLKVMKVSGPYLIVAPLSTLANWVEEFNTFTPDINVILYHGSKAERQHLLRFKMPIKKQKNHDFPVVVTSYEIVMNDRKHLQKYSWKYIVVDEGHRLKNMNCRLVRELKQYTSANRLLLTGTPLQNNLSELWSLLNFLLPDIFDNLELFQTWFNFSDIEKKSGQERILKEEEEDHIITSLHTILKPFLLRRLKTDVEHSLPKKKEYLLYAPLTRPQKNLYDAILNRNVRNFLIKRKTNDQDDNDILPLLEKQPILDQENTNTDGEKLTTRQRKSSRALKNVDYKESCDREYFKQQQRLQTQLEASEPITAKTNLEIGKKHEMKSALKHVNDLHLQNLVMQLRKVCNHPFLFDWPIDHKTGNNVVNNDLIAQSGKMMLLEKLLTSLFARGHRVLVFSQMTKMMDIIEDWAVDLKGWPTCRLDGSVAQDVRRQQIAAFNHRESTIPLFLLSTRAGGLGINLTAADTVIIFDSDWNPQMDLQAQDRAHRIGQTKPVLVYRFVAANTVDAKVLERANAKRRLEKLVISKGKFRAPATAADKKEKVTTMSELAEILASEDGEQVQIVAQGDQVISNEDLEKLLDRSEETMNAQNTSSSGGFKEFETERDSKNELLATRI